MQSTDVVIREAEVGDMPALLRLAELDSRHVPDGKLLVAQVDGEIRAAIGTRTGAVIADPFVPAAELAELLRLRAEQVGLARQGHGTLRALSPRRAH